MPWVPPQGTSPRLKPTLGTLPRVGFSLPRIGCSLPRVGAECIYPTQGRLKPTLGRVPKVGSNLGEVSWVGTQGTYPGYLPKVI